MAPKGRIKGKGKARAKMPTSVMNQRLSLEQNGMKGFILEHICRPIRIYNVCGINDERVWDVLHDIIFLDRVTTGHFSQFQLMWPHCRSRSSHFWYWWAAFPSYMGQMFDTTHDQMNNWRWDNPHAIDAHVDCSNLEITSSGKGTKDG
jgi:hypothetical protein